VIPARTFRILTSCGADLSIAIRAKGRESGVASASQSLWETDAVALTATQADS
jgi:hypothetical protein